MSIRIMAHVWDNGPCDKSEILILLALADFCNDAGQCWPSVSTIAQKARMTERGARKIIARLEDMGWLEIDYRNGRSGCNLYTVKTLNHVHPEPRSPLNTVPQNPEPRSPNPEPRSPKPLEPSKEPSLLYSDPVKDVLLQWASQEAVDSFLAYRKKHKSKALTATAAKRLASNLKTIFNEGGNTDDALGMAEERGWATVQPDWYFKSKSGNAGTQSIRSGEDSQFRDAVRSAINF